MSRSIASLDRWRLVLGRFSENGLGPGPGGDLGRMEQALDFLYSREYRGRGVREEKKGGGLGASQLAVPRWIAEAEKLFPRETVEILERHALDRYGMTELVDRPETLKRLEPSLELLETLLRFKGRMKSDVLAELRRIIAEVVRELKEKLEPEVRSALGGKIHRFRPSRLRVRQNLDWRDTIRRNLKHYDPERRKLIVSHVRFFSRVERRLPWTLILCVDQSASMASSVVHSAVLAGIFAGLPSLELKLVVFDTSVVDLSDRVDDPVEILMSVQLGGGTNIGQALAYCEQLVTHPRRTAVVLLSDFEEGASPHKLVGLARRLREAGVTLLGLAALDEAAEPAYDSWMAERLVAAGMEIAALTPRALAAWLAGILR